MATTTITMFKVWLKHLHWHSDISQGFNLNNNFNNAVMILWFDNFNFISRYLL